MKEHTVTEQLKYSPELSRQIEDRAIVLRDEYEQKLWKQTDRMFAVLLAVQWLAGIAMAVWLSPRAWEGLESHIHPHIWAAVWVGGLIAAFPIMLAIVRPGEAMTRYVIATAQMLHSAMLIHLSGGRIETHFHVFGSLAFLSFYRDWRVLVPATIVVAADHALRGIFWPESVFGVLVASPWRWIEHAGWVVFEDIILVWACVRGAKELATLASRQAELEATKGQVEAEVARQTSRLDMVSQELIATARRAGMAEIATGVLHNVGNVLNSVNVSTDLAMRKLHDSEVSTLLKVADLLQLHQSDLATFLTTDARGKQVPSFVTELAQCLSLQQKNLIDEMQTVVSGLDHIKEIVSAQQQHAKSGALRQKISPAELFEKAMAMDIGSSAEADIKLLSEFHEISPIPLEKHKVLQILINLINNAKKAVKATSGRERRIVLITRRLDSGGKPTIRFEVADNGAGIRTEDLTKIFAHGFTTREDGHGFGLHSAANAAREMGGSLSVTSEGIDKGATFTLDLPIANLTSAEQFLLSTKKEEPCPVK
jgi:signal transduction histidine kinase